MTKNASAHDTLEPLISNLQSNDKQQIDRSPIRKNDVNLWNVQDSCITTLRHQIFKSILHFTDT